MRNVKKTAQAITSVKLNGKFSYVKFLGLENRTLMLEEKLEINKTYCNLWAVAGVRLRVRSTNFSCSFDPGFRSA